MREKERGGSENKVRTYVRFRKRTGKIVPALLKSVKYYGNIRDDGAEKHFVVVHVSSKSCFSSSCKKKSRRDLSSVTTTHSATGDFVSKSNRLF